VGKNQTNGGQVYTQVRHGAGSSSQKDGLMTTPEFPLFKRDSLTWESELRQEMRGCSGLALAGSQDNRGVIIRSSMKDIIILGQRMAASGDMSPKGQQHLVRGRRAGRGYFVLEGKREGGS